MPREVKVLFASGTAELNRAAIDHFSAREPDLPMYVVAEFHPHKGEWIPWHVMRPIKENRRAIEAELTGREIAAAAMVMVSGTAHVRMRAVALAVTQGRIVAYDEELRVLEWQDAPGHIVRQMLSLLERQFSRGGRARRWIERIANPRDAEVPVRARAAQAYGIAASKLRGLRLTKPLRAADGLQPGVTVVIPTRDGRKLLETMLPHIAPQVAGIEGAGEIIVVDNGSSDGTRGWLKQFWPNITVVESVQALSFAAAINAGLAQARFRHTLLLNNDMIVEPGFVAALLDSFDRVPGLFCSTAQIFFPPGVRREETGKAVWRQESSLDFPVRCDDPLPAEDLTPVLYGSGGCSLFDTAKLCGLGGIAEIYDPAYVEDLDFGYRAWKRGWPTVYCAGARVEHRHRATTSRFFTERQLEFFTERNYLRFLASAVSDQDLFQTLWASGVRRLQLLAMSGNAAALDALRDIPWIGAVEEASGGLLTEPEILALGNGNAAAFPGRRARGRKTVIIATPYLPFPLSHGGAVRMYNLMCSAAEEFDLVLLTFCDALATPADPLLNLCAEVILIRREGSHYRKGTDRPDTVEEFDSATFRACLKQSIRRWNAAIVQLEFTWMAQYASSCAPAKTILVEHDITWDLQEQLLAAGGQTGAARWELEQQLEKWRRFETEAWNSVDCVAVMSGKDADTAKTARHTIVLPNGVDCTRFRPVDREPEAWRLLFIGSFRHTPNVQGLAWFLNEVWPKLHPAFQLHVIAGARHHYFLDLSGMSAEIDLSDRRLEVEGFVEDVRPAYERVSIVIAPLIASAGTNIKVLEAMAMGKVVVSTPAGVNGLDVTDGRDVIVRADAAVMARELAALSRDAHRRAAVSRRARETALRYDWAGD
jgi:GT2 family glycosyltransferase/glycosyltransferase involved in cell wall biosynthesis